MRSEPRALYGSKIPILPASWQILFFFFFFSTFLRCNVFSVGRSLHNSICLLYGIICTDCFGIFSSLIIVKVNRNRVRIFKENIELIKNKKKWRSKIFNFTVLKKGILSEIGERKASCLKYFLLRGKIKKYIEIYPAVNFAAVFLR